jgi:hypothetical protein
LLKPGKTVTVELQLVFEEKKEYLLLSATGFQSARVNIKIAEAAIKECVAREKDRALIDLRGLTGSTGTMEDYELAKLMETWAVGQIIHKVALIERPELFESAKFLETALQNRSINFRAFTDIEEGKKWIAG